MVDRAKAKLWLFAGIVLIAAILWSIDHYRDWLTNDVWIWLGTTPDGRVESNSATLRNVGLVIAAVVALPLAIWRSKVAERQADTAQRGLLNERYQTGAEMLGSNVLSVRLGGIYALQRLADEHPEHYHVQVIHLFCAFARNPTESKGREHGRHAEEAPPHPTHSLREDVQAVMMAIGNRSSEHVGLEAQARLHLDMRGSDLRRALLIDMNLTTPPWQFSTLLPMSEMFGRHTDLSEAKLCSAEISFAKLENADLANSCLCRARLARTNLSGALLVGTNLHGALSLGPILSGAKFSINGVLPARGIRQSDLDSCKADPDNPPDLTGVVDAETGEPLVWSGKPLDAKS